MTNPLKRIKTMKNRYAARAKLSEHDLRDIVRLFSRNREAAHIAREIEMSRTTVNAYLRKIRLAIAEQCVLESATASAKRSVGLIFSVQPVVRPKKGAGTAPCEVLRGLVRGDGQISAEALPGKDTEVLRILRKGRLIMNGWEHMEGVRQFSRQIDLDFQSLDQAEILAHVSGKNKPSSMETIQLFLAYLRSRMACLRGVHLETFRLHLKESEFRFNVAAQGGYLSRRVLAILRGRPLA